jgi:hypothetical protein
MFVRNVGMNCKSRRRHNSECRHGQLRDQGGPLIETGFQNGDPVSVHSTLARTSTFVVQKEKCQARRHPLMRTLPLIPEPEKQMFIIPIIIVVIGIVIIIIAFICLVTLLPTRLSICRTNCNYQQI